MLWHPKNLDMSKLWPKNKNLNFLQQILWKTAIFGVRNDLGLGLVCFFSKQSHLMPVPSACSKNIFTAFKFFCACSIFFEHSQIFWSWSKARFYLINLHIWAWSKIFEHIQKILNTVKNIWTWSKNIWTSRWIRH